MPHEGILLLASSDMFNASFNQQRSGRDVGVCPQSKSSSVLLVLATPLSALLCGHVTDWTAAWNGRNAIV